MDIQNLRYFVAVAQTLNITKAAEQLFITRQALSKAISEFEKECGSALFFRKNGKLQITPFGRSLLEESTPIVDLFNNFEKSVTSSSASKKSKIHIAIGLGAVNSLSPRLFADFRKEHPETEIILKEVCDDEVRMSLETQETDIGIQNTTPENIKDFDYQLVQAGQICFQISKDNPLSKKEIIQPVDLAAQPFVTLGRRNDTHNMVMEKCAEAGVSPNIVLETLDSNVANHMAYDNTAISLFILAKGEVVNPLVRIVSLDLGDTPWGTYVLTRKDLRPTLSMHQLIDYLVNYTD
jgi:LysR family transcriptional activator of glutamate synthase operon